MFPLWVLLYSLLKNLLLALVRLLTMPARKPAFLCRLINEPINSKSTAIDAAIIAIIYCHLLRVYDFLGTGSVGSTEQGEKSSVTLKNRKKKKNLKGPVELHREDERNIKVGTFSVGARTAYRKGSTHIVGKSTDPDK